MSQFITDDEKRLEALKLGTGAQFYSERGRSNSVPDVIKRAEPYYEFLAHKPKAEKTSIPSAKRLSSSKK